MFTRNKEKGLVEEKIYRVEETGGTERAKNEQQEANK
jgi:hypothetical protein